MGPQDNATTFLHRHDRWFILLALLYRHTASVVVNTMFVTVHTVL